MAVQPFLVELRPTDDLATAAATAAAAGPEPVVDPNYVVALGVALDPAFPPTPIPGMRPRARDLDDPHDIGPAFELSPRPEDATYVVRAGVDEADLDRVRAELRAADAVAGVYADEDIHAFIVCPGDPAVGTDADVERLLCTSRLHAGGADGAGVLVAIVDTGVNVAYLRSRGKSPTFDAARSWVPAAGLTAGSLPVSHGTMCAYDVLIAAPRCTLLDVAVLQSAVTGPNVMAGLLSDALRAYSHLLTMTMASTQAGHPLSLVVNNSWGMFHPRWDFPVDDPGNYSDNPDHPFNRVVASLEQAGADILFAAGNCGRDCPDGRCRSVTTNAIYGANGHPSVLCVAGVDTTNARVGYSSIGPGRLTQNKPDISGYTHFAGSGVYPADGGTSAATPVVAGVVAAVRSKRPYSPSDSSTSPASIRTLLTSTAVDLGPAGYDFLHGFGVVGGCQLADRLVPGRLAVDLCRRHPWLCDRLPELCRRYPALCRRLDIPPTSGVDAASDGPVDVEDDAAVLLAYFAGLDDGRSGRDDGGPPVPAAAPERSGRGCTC